MTRTAEDMIDDMNDCNHDGTWEPQFKPASDEYQRTFACPPGTFICRWCGFPEGHDYACRLLQALGEKRPTRGTGHLAEVLVPPGGLPASQSFF